MVLVGDDATSQVYMRNMARQCQEAGMASFEHRLPATTSQAELMALVARLNADPAVQGILVQLPLPAALDDAVVLQAVDPDKDVDGFHPINVGRLGLGQPLLVPCTPVGCELLIRSVLPDMAGAHAVVIGRSNIVGKPMAQLLLAANCTVTIAHSRTRDLPALARSADIAAGGRCGVRRGRKRGGFHHAGAGGCGADDDRLLAAQHGDCGVPRARNREAGGVVMRALVRRWCGAAIAR